MTDDVSKLPAWPPLRVQYESEMEPCRTNALLRHAMAERDAYRARMEALVARIEGRELHMHSAPCMVTPTWPEYPCTCGLYALLDACEREEER